MGTGLILYQVFHYFFNATLWYQSRRLAQNEWACIYWGKKIYSENVCLFFTDSEIPVIFDTPPSQNVSTEATAIVSWTPPTASDNSGEAVTLISDYSPGDTFPIGTTTVTYTATDAYGNTATSSFDVVVTCTGKKNSQLFRVGSH